MVSIAKVRNLLVTVKELAIYLNDEEISDIGKVLLKATIRMEGEQEGTNDTASTNNT